MTKYGTGAFEVFYRSADGSTEYRKAYRTLEDAEKARDFLEALGIYPAIDITTVKQGYWR